MMISLAWFERMKRNVNSDTVWQSSAFGPELGSHGEGGRGTAAGGTNCFMIITRRRRSAGRVHTEPMLDQIDHGR